MPPEGGSVSPVARRGPGGQGVGRASEPPAVARCCAHDRLGGRAIAPHVPDAVRPGTSSPRRPSLERRLRAPDARRPVLSDAAVASRREGAIAQSAAVAARPRTTGGPPPEGSGRAPAGTRDQAIRPDTMARSCRRRPAGTGLLASARRPSPLSSEDGQSAGIAGRTGHDEAGDRVTIKLGQPEWDREVSPRPHP